MASEKICVLYVDDEVNNLLSFKASFRRYFDIVTVESADEARKVLQEKKFHVIITDQRMPGITGVEFLESILEIYPDPIRILLTGFADIEAVVAAINKGQVYKYIAKPWVEEELKAIIETAYGIIQLREEKKKLTSDLKEVNEQLEFMLRQKLLS